MNRRHRVNWTTRSVGLSALAIAMLSLVEQPTAAQVFKFTSSEDFLEALSGTPFIVEGYESLPLDTVLGPGETINGVTYTTWSAGFGGLIGNNFANIGTRSLYLERDGLPGEGEADYFFPGDTFSVAFDKPVTAIGMFFNVVPGPDLEFMFIQTPVGTVSTGGFNPDMGTFFFAGLISDVPFDTATIGSTFDAPSGWNADNLIFAPIPSPAVLALFGAAGLFIRRRRR